jgi:hypothetical protein
MGLSLEANRPREEVEERGEVGETEDREVVGCKRVSTRRLALGIGRSGPPTDEFLDCISSCAVRFAEGNE